MKTDTEQGDCKTCEGTGNVMSRCCAPLPVHLIECDCGRGGGYIEEDCPDCKGTGKEEENDE